MSDVFADHDMRDQVYLALGLDYSVYDLQGIVDELQDRHGTVDIDTINATEFWMIVSRHVRSDG